MQEVVLLWKKRVEDHMEKELNGCIELQLKALENNSKFTLTLKAIYDFVKGFYYLLFKPFCLPFFVDATIFSLFEGDDLEKINQMEDISCCVKVVVSLNILKNSQIAVAAENMMRHKPFLKLKQRLCEIIMDVDNMQHSLKTSISDN